MRFSRNFALYVVLLSIIFGCVRYAYARESVRDTDLQALYRAINQDSFAGSLPHAQVSWSYLEKEEGTTRAYPDGRFEIEIDRATNTTHRELLDTLHEEMCHVETLPSLNGQDAHGPLFQTCMLRFLGR